MTRLQSHRSRSVTLWQQEIEEDKKKAEQEGIAVTTPRKPRPHEPEADRRKTEKENLTVTVDLSKPAAVRTKLRSTKPRDVEPSSVSYRLTKTSVLSALPLRTCYQPRSIMSDTLAQCDVVTHLLIISLKRL